MADLPLIEQVLIFTAMGLYLLAACLALSCLAQGKKVYWQIVDRLVSLAVVAKTMMLVFRAVEIDAFPLTGSFESLILLTIAFGLIFMVFGIWIRQIWFGMLMSWTIFVMVAIAAVFARPAVEAGAHAARPWAIAHGLAMILGEGMILLAAVSAVLFLIADYRLKQKKIGALIGRVPNLQTLGRLNRLGLLGGFVLVTLGGISGMGMVCIGAEEFGGHMDRWIRDWRVLSIIATWILIGFALLAQTYGWLNSRVNAWLSVCVLGLISAVLICPV